MSGPAAKTDAHAIRNRVGAWSARRDEAFRRGGFSECATLCRRILVSSPTDPRSLQLLARVHGVRENTRETEVALTRLHVLLPGNVAVLGALARSAFAAEDHDAAEAWCRRALALDESVPERWLDLARIARAQGRLAESEAAIARAVGLDTSYDLYRRVLALTVTREDFAFHPGDDERA